MNTTARFTHCPPATAARALPHLLPALLLLTLLGALLAPTPALAHRVNIFAWLEGDAVMVKCGFNRSSPVKNGQVIVFDAVNGQELLQGRTDETGHFSFPVPRAVRDGHGLRIRVVAGEGHQNEWSMDVSEFSSAAAPTASPSEKAEGAASPATSAAPSASDARNASGTHAAPVTADEVRAIVDAALDAKLGPIRRDLAAQANAAPGLQEIVGGIGWILGLVGIGLYFKRRRA